MAAVIPRSSNTANSSSSNSVVVTKPTGLAVGDFMIAPVSANISGASLTVATPTGWTSLGSSTNSDVYETCFWKTADSADVAASNFTFTCTGTGTATVMQAGVACWSSANSTTPIDQSITANNTASVAGITPTTAMGQFVMVLSGYNASGTTGSIAGYQITNNNPTWTEVFDAGISNGSKFFGVAVAYSNSTRLAATGTASATLTGYTDTKIILLNIVPTAMPSLSVTPIMPTPSMRYTASPFVATANMPTPTASTLSPMWAVGTKATTAWTNDTKH